MIHWYDDLTERLRAAGDWLAPLGLRLLLFYEFWSAGNMKLRGSNWFENIQSGFPFPFSMTGAELNWLLATWTELAAAVALLFGLFTRFFAFALLVLTSVAVVAVHWPADWSNLGELWRGYVVTDQGFGNFRIGFLFMAMLLPLVFLGGGRFSLDHLLLKFSGRAVLTDDRTADITTFGFACLVVGLPLFYLIPMYGATALVLALITLFYPVFKNRF